MTKVSKKIQRTLERRLNGYTKACEMVDRKKSGSSNSITRPGSRNPKKT